MTQTTTSTFAEAVPSGPRFQHGPDEDGQAGQGMDQSAFAEAVPDGPRLQSGLDEDGQAGQGMDQSAFAEGVPGGSRFQHGQNEGNQTGQGMFQMSPNPWESARWQADQELIDIMAQGEKDGTLHKLLDPTSPKYVVPGIVLRAMTSVLGLPTESGGRHGVMAQFHAAAGLTLMDTWPVRQYALDADRRELMAVGKELPLSWIRENGLLPHLLGMSDTPLEDPVLRKKVKDAVGREVFFNTPEELKASLGDREDITWYPGMTIAGAHSLAASQDRRKKLETFVAQGNGQGGLSYEAAELLGNIAGNAADPITWAAGVLGKAAPAAKAALPWVQRLWAWGKHSFVPGAVLSGVDNFSRSRDLDGRGGNFSNYDALQATLMEIALNTGLKGFGSVVGTTVKSVMGKTGAKPAAQAVESALGREAVAGAQAAESTLGKEARAGVQSVARKPLQSLAVQGVSALPEPDASIRQTVAWKSAKLGNKIPARQLVDSLWTREHSAQLRAALDPARETVFLPMPSSSGRNIIPETLAVKLSQDLGGSVADVKALYRVEGSPIKTVPTSKRVFEKREFIVRDKQGVAALCGKQVVLVEDQITTGTSVKQFIAALRKQGVEVHTTASLMGKSNFDLNPSQIDNLQKSLRKAEMEGLFRAEDLADVLTPRNAESLGGSLRQVKTPQDREAMTGKIQALLDAAKGTQP